LELKLNIAISLVEHEDELALKWFSWVAELGGTEGHNLFLLPAHGYNAINVIAQAKQAFQSVTVLQDSEKEKSDWQNPEPLRSASGPNSSFRQFAWHFYYAKLGPYFWCEIDCIPTRKDWLDKLQSEYRSCGKPFMGAKVEIERVPLHLSGNACYPQNVPEVAPTLVMRTNWTVEGKEYELAFDIAGAVETLRQAAFTNLIQHKFRHPGFKTRAEYEATIDRNAVVFHSCKDGSIIPFLREDLGGVLNAENIGHEKGKQASMLPPSPSPSPARQDLGRHGAEREVRTGALSDPHETPAQTKVEKWRANAAKARAALAEKVAKRKEGEKNAARRKGKTSGSDSRRATGNPSQDSRIATREREETSSHSTASSGNEQQVAKVEPNVQPAGSPVSSDGNHAENQGLVPKVESKTFGMSQELIERVLNESALKPMKKPWEDKEESMKEVRLMSETLKLFCTAPMRTKFVRDSLRESGVIK
jgi:hypothetical protein